MPYSKTADKYKGIERRKHTRLDKNRGIVFYRLQGRNNERMLESFINNISVNGLSFGTFEPIKAGDNLECEIYQLIDCQKNIIISICVFTKVIWVNRKEKISKARGGDKYQIGAEFVEIEKEDRDRIIEYVERVKKG